MADDRPIQIQLDPPALFNLRIQEFDKKIAEAEAIVADLKKQKMTYAYDTNVQFILDQYKASQIKQAVTAASAGPVTIPVVS